MGKGGRQDALQCEAWIGDAVLELYARLKILREDGRPDGDKAQSICSNQFLTAFGEPTSVEAEIGRAYGTGGIDAAFGWIEKNLMPLYERQQQKKLRKA